jgi:signal transduction protein with GAF and PtsI domain
MARGFLFRRMKVTFTTKEYARILELAYMGLRVASSDSETPDSLPERYADAAQKLFALATPFGCADLVEEVAEDEFQPSEKLESGPVLEKLARFTEDAFWRELVERLAERDLRAELGATKLTEELNEEEEKRLEEIEDSYWREFEAKGTDFLILLKGGRG